MQAGEYIEARITLLTTAEGGRKHPYINITGWNDMDHPLSRMPGEELFHRTIFIEAPQKVELGESFDATLWLMWFPKDAYEDYQADHEFDLFEGNHLIGRGTIIRRFSVG